MPAFFKLQRQCACGGIPGPSGECAECRKQRLAAKASPAHAGSPLGASAASMVEEVLRTPGQSLDPATRGLFEPRFGHDFSRVRVHTGGEAEKSARAVNALAFTVGSHIAFGAGQFAPGTFTGQSLLAHELSHVIQQGESEHGRAANTAGIDKHPAHEQAADRAAEAVMRRGGVPPIGAVGQKVIQRKVEMRDVGRGEQSGFDRLPKLIERLNAMSKGLIFAHTGKSGDPLTCTVKPGGTLSNFDTQMRGFIDQAAVLPMRLTNRSGLLGDHASGFHTGVDGDAFASGYVDIDDLLAGSDLGLQLLMVHFLRERSATSQYSQRIGAGNFTRPEFDRAHGLGIEAEANVLRDFFGDPTIRILQDSPSPTVRRVFQNSRHARISRRIKQGSGAESGVGGSYIEVVTSDGVKHTDVEYLQILKNERAAGPKAP